MKWKNINEIRFTHKYDIMR